mgnify:CR=1 FL=1
MGRKKAAPKPVEPTIKYKSLYTGNLITAQQWLVEGLYANGGIYDVGAAIREGAVPQKDYVKSITIVSRLLKLYPHKDLYQLIVSKNLTGAELLAWWAENTIGKQAELAAIPKIEAKTEEVVFDAGEDLRVKADGPVEPPPPNNSLSQRSIFKALKDLGNGEKEK